MTHHTLMEDISERGLALLEKRRWEAQVAEAALAATLDKDPALHEQLRAEHYATVAEETVIVMDCLLHNTVVGLLNTPVRSDVLRRALASAEEALEGQDSAISATAHSVNEHPDM